MKIIIMKDKISYINLMNVKIDKIMILSASWYDLINLLLLFLSLRMLYRVCVKRLITMRMISERK